MRVLGRKIKAVCARVGDLVERVGCEAHLRITARVAIVCRVLLLLLAAKERVVSGTCTPARDHFGILR